MLFLSILICYATLETRVLKYISHPPTVPGKNIIENISSLPSYKVVCRIICITKETGVIPCFPYQAQKPPSPFFPIMWMFFPITGPGGGGGALPLLGSILTPFLTLRVKPNLNLT